MIIEKNIYGVIKMLNYLLDVGLSPEEIYDINHNLNEDIIGLLELSKNKSIEVIEYYKAIGITNLTGLIINRPDLVLINKAEAISQSNKIETELFVDLINNNIEDLIIFGV